MDIVQPKVSLVFRVVTDLLFVESGIAEYSKIFAGCYTNGRYSRITGTLIAYSQLISWHEINENVLKESRLISRSAVTV